MLLVYKGSELFQRFRMITSIINYIFFDNLIVTWVELTILNAIAFFFAGDLFVASFGAWSLEDGSISRCNHRGPGLMLAWWPRKKVYDGKVHETKVGFFFSGWYSLFCLFWSLWRCGVVALMFKFQIQATQLSNLGRATRVTRVEVFTSWTIHRWWPWLVHGVAAVELRKLER